MKKDQKEQLLAMVVSSIVRANHLLVACEMAEKDDADGLVIPVPQLQTLARTLGTLAYAFTTTGVFKAEEIEERVVEVTKVERVLNLAVQMMSQGADDETVATMFDTFGVNTDEEGNELILQAKRLFNHIKEEHPEILQDKFVLEQHFQQMGMSANLTKH
jgi:hypothetical protein